MRVFEREREKLETRGRPGAIWRQDASVTNLVALIQHGAVVCELQARTLRIIVLCVCVYVSAFVVQK